MKIVNEYSRERFTEEEILIVQNVANVVCKVFGVTIDELKSDVRVRPVPDARKVICHYLAKNIRLENFQGRYHIALATWFLNQDHSTVSYAVKQAGFLYETDIFFKAAYDNVVNMINNPDDYDFNLVLPIVNESDVSWNDVRRNCGYKYEKKKKLIPTDVSKRIIEMYEAGYSISNICREMMVGDKFLNKYVKDLGLQRLDICDKKPRILLSSRNYDSFRAPTRTICKTIDY